MRRGLRTRFALSVRRPLRIRPPRFEKQIRPEAHRDSLQLLGGALKLLWLSGSRALAGAVEADAAGEPLGADGVGEAVGDDRADDRDRGDVEDQLSVADV
jgi:hypothetical protein